KQTNKQTAMLVLVLCVCPGACRPELCTDPDRCLLAPDRTSCTCAFGFYAERCDRDAGIKVTCGKDFIAIRVLEDFFRYHNVPLEALHLPNSSCRAQRQVIAGDAFYTSRISTEQYAACGGKPLERNITHVSYSLSLLSDPQAVGNIIRDPLVKIDYTCVYPYIRTVSLPFPVIPFSSEKVMRVDELDATVQMLLYTDGSYSEAHRGAPTIELRDKVYVEVKVTEPAGFFLLRVDECWATQSSRPNASEDSAHTLLLDGCVSDQTVRFLGETRGQPGGNGESSAVRYSFDMFRFTAAPHDLYLHCTVQLCEPDDTEACKPNCKSISKREAVRAAPAAGLLSYGPIRIEMPHRPQSSIVAMAVLPVAGIWIVGLFLIVLITVAKAGRRRLARLQEH
uniref:Zona pellucida glycoprotein d n=1 Tax=Myripristis murdjan TaxID=586833 RepID=A0A667Y044_9TELE